MHPIATQLNQLRDEMNVAFKERDDAVEALTLATLCAEHVFILGTPGTGKTKMSEVFFAAFTGARWFQQQMSRTRPAEAVLGPTDVLELRTNGNFWRKIDGYLLTAHFALIDEIGKMSPVLGHDLLGALNERVRYEVNVNGSVHKIPLLTTVACSNEVPTDESDDAAALWDRLLFRTIVEPVKSGTAFAALMVGPDPAALVNVKIDFDDLKQAIEVEVPQVQIGDAVLKSILVLKKKLTDKGVSPSDRRWRQSMKALKAAAFLAGRTEVHEEDLAALRFTLWDTIPQIEDITKLTSSASNPFVERLLKSKSALQEIVRGIEERADRATSEKSEYAKEINPKLAAVRTDLDKLLAEAGDRSIPGFKAVADTHESALIRMYSECFGLDMDATKQIVAGKLGAGDGTKVPVNA